jgi:hypothetical protein
MAFHHGRLAKHQGNAFMGIVASGTKFVELRQPAARSGIIHHQLDN